MSLRQTLLLQEKERVSSLQRRFFERCRASGIDGQFASLEGYVIDAICERSRHMDVVIAAIPPGKDTAPNDALSGSQAMLRCCHVPLLTMRGSPYRIKRALLAYDGSPQADTALYAAAYLADSLGRQSSGDDRARGQPHQKHLERPRKSQNLP